MIKAIFQAIRCVLAGMSIGFQGFGSAYFSLSKLNDLKLQIYSYVTGVPLWIFTAISVISTVATTYLIFKKIIKKSCRF